MYTFVTKFLGLKNGGVKAYKKLLMFFLKYKIFKKQK